MENGVAAMENSMVVPQKLKRKLLTSCHPAISLMNVHRIIEARLLRNICTPMMIAALFTVVKRPQQMNG